MCKRNLYGRLVLNKGDKPYTSKEIEVKLQKQWQTAAPWTLLSLGRVFMNSFLPLNLICKLFGQWEL